jgi:hypothetical protein
MVDVAMVPPVSLVFLPPHVLQASIRGAHSSMPAVSDSTYSLQSCAPFPSRVATSCRAKQQQQWLQLLWRQEKIFRGLLAALVAAAAAQVAPEVLVGGSWWRTTIALPFSNQSPSCLSSH